MVVHFPVAVENYREVGNLDFRQAFIFKISVKFI
jgi:hypothetical protein